MSAPQVVLVKVSGEDRPGITSTLTGILSQSNATILDIGQSVIHGQLSLSIMFEMNASEGKATLKDLLFSATEMGLKLDFQVVDMKESPKQPKPLKRYAITLMSSPITALSLHRVTEVISQVHCNIDLIQRLSNEEFSCVELLLHTSENLDEAQLKENLLKIATELNVDIALQEEGLFRRTKRLVVLDMDSTLIQNEVIDEFARKLGKYDEVAAITHSAMKGDIGFDESLNQRVALLKGLKQDEIQAVFSELKLTNGAKELILILKKLGYKVALISGGFDCIADRFKTELGIDYAYANKLEMKDGVCTGKVIPPILNAQRKADLLDVISQTENISLDQVIAIGDGANDLKMLEKAGLGIAFNAKPAVQEKADLSINQKNLRSILYLLGIPGRDISQGML